MGDVHKTEPLDQRQMECNFPYYHEAHTFVVVTKGLSVKPVLVICDGTGPKDF